jgi:hypothetical protein
VDGVEEAWAVRERVTKSAMAFCTASWASSIVAPITIKILTSLRYSAA